MARARLLVAGAAAAYAFPAALAYSPVSRLIGVHRRLRDRETVGVTFDDGPQPGSTEHFIRLLGQLGVRATFFLVGAQVQRFPSLARQIRSEGHEIASHGFRHRNHFLRSPTDLGEDLRRGREAIEDVLAERPELFRPPQGVVTAATRLAAYRADSPIVLWSAWGRDWRVRATADSIVHDALRSLRGGDILLLHDADYYAGRTWHGTFEALPRIVEGIRARGLTPGPLNGRESLEDVTLLSTSKHRSMRRPAIR